MDRKIYVVIVTYNRLEKLKKALESYAKQEFQPSDIIIINNCSTDGTTEYLNNWKNDSSSPSNKHVYHMERNLGGAGGFRIGIQKALSMNPDWVWISDDDAYPQPDALRIVNDNIDKKEFSNAVCFCGTVCDKRLDKIDVWHRRYNKKRGILIPLLVSENEYKLNHKIIEETSFVGSCYKSSALRKAGLPNDNLFIYFDDTEYSHRIGKYGQIILLPKIKVLHDTGAYSYSAPDVISTWREYYLVRNHVYTLKKYHWPTFIAYCIMKAIKVYREYRVHRSKDTLKMHLTGIKDGMKERLGVHPIYKPGYEIKKK